MAKLELYYEEVVVGWTIEAAIFAIRQNIPLLVSDEFCYHIDDFLEYHSFEEFGFENTSIELLIDGIFSKRGQPKRKLIDHLFWLLSVNGLLFGGRIKRLSNDDFLVGSFSIKYDCAYVFSPASVEGLMRKTKSRLFKVSDMFHVYEVSSQEHDAITREEDFINSIWMPRSRLHNSKAYQREFHAISYLTEDELKDLYFGPRFSEFQAIEFLSDRNIRGRKDKVHKGKTYYKKAKLDFIERVVTEITDYRDKLPAGMINCMDTSLDTVIEIPQKKSFINNSCINALRAKDARLPREIL